MLRRQSVACSCLRLRRLLKPGGALMLGGLLSPVRLRLNLLFSQRLRFNVRRKSY
ncbi:hypothetical protein MCHI_002726 [Candidatus Magnetoovum chiemensis]|nr:hypothetical protein MCHI_002726 [Candidatus Magnetoovum chiemensis]